MNKILNLLLVVSTLVLSQGAMAARVQSAQSMKPEELFIKIKTIRGVFEKAKDEEDVTSSFEALLATSKAGNKIENEFVDGKLKKCINFARSNNVYVKQATKIILQCKNQAKEENIKTLDKVFKAIQLEMLLSKENLTLNELKQILTQANITIVLNMMGLKDENELNSLIIFMETNEHKRYPDYLSLKNDKNQYESLRRQIMEINQCSESIAIDRKGKTSYLYKNKDKDALLAIFDEALKAIEDSYGSKTETESDTGKQATSSVKPSASAKSSESPTVTKTSSATKAPATSKATTTPSTSPKPSTATSSSTPTAKPSEEPQFIIEIQSATPTAKPSKSPTATKTPSATKTPKPTATPKVVKSYKDLSNEELTRIGNTKPSKRTAEEASLYEQYRQARRAGAL